MADAEPLEEAKPQDCGLPGGELIEQGFEGLGFAGLRRGGFVLLLGYEIQQAAAAWELPIEAGQPPGMLGAAQLLLFGWDSDGPAEITGVVEEGALDAAREIGGS